MPTPEYLEAERRRNAAQTTRENVWATVALVGLGLLIWAAGGANALI
jgi:hypothetical protein